MRSIIRAKYQFDQGNFVTSTVIGVFNTSLLIVATGDKLKAFTGFKDTRYLVACAASAYIIGTWLIGWLMSKYKLIELYQDEANNQNRLFRQMSAKSDAVGEKLTEDRWVSCVICNRIFCIQEGNKFRWECRKCAPAGTT